jgi:Fic family protein
MRSYEKTHPWITFKADLRPAPHTLWLLLGEARSKCERVAGVPLKPDIAKKLNEVYLVKGVHGTAAIEGNSLSEEQIEQRIEGTLQVPPSKEYQAREIDNLVQSFNDILERLKKEGQPSEAISCELIKSFNFSILKGLTLEDGVVPGQIRKHSVGVADYKGAPAEDCEYLLLQLCNWLNREDFDSDNSLGVAAAILKAIIGHLYIAWIHPFGDGNGRTARLVEFYLLVNAGVPVPSAHLLSDYYNTTRSEYYRNLSLASKSGGYILPFLQYATTGFVEELRQQLEYIRAQQWSIAWKDFVNEFFDDVGSSETHLRRKYLLLDLAKEAQPVPRGKLTQISARVATYYARKTDKALTRDLNALLGARLIARSKAGYRARRELILAFLPPTWKASRSGEVQPKRN